SQRARAWSTRAPFAPADSDEDEFYPASTNRRSTRTKHKRNNTYEELHPILNPPRAGRADRNTRDQPRRRFSRARRGHQGKNPGLARRSRQDAPANSSDHGGTQTDEHQRC